MSKYAVIKTGGKQYLIKEGQEIIVDKLNLEKKAKAELETLATFDDEGKQIDLGTPNLTTKVQIEVIDNLLGDKLRVAHFKAKVRYRKVRGFRQKLSKIKILKI